MMITIWIEVFEDVTLRMMKRAVMVLGKQRQFIHIVFRPTKKVMCFATRGVKHKIGYMAFAVIL